ncbi:hypothetical protein ASA1KI_13260 [Opitutales bacterium ASA1]|uniref:glycerophosphodiester phosphodiesterase family protein n=1 Tax=Congregicoccus parvus TaxID=3081749 RepID=UPI002B30AC7F|nr:hypothetical protein ASA1KI_13260 [Opitutales bacterium ASA1]
MTARFQAPSPLHVRRLAWLVAIVLLAVSSAVPSLGTPSTRSVNPPGGIRPLVAEIDGRWIGNGVSFSPYRRGQAPGGAMPSADEILEDLRIVARHWNFIRMYSTTENAAPTLRLIREHRLPLRMILGAWIAPEHTPEARASNRREIEAAVALANEYPDLVLAVSVGNETQVHWSGHRSDTGALIDHIRNVRGGIQQPVTTADDYNFWNKPEARAVVDEIDFVMLHAYALWNGRSLDEAMAWTSDVYDSICGLHPDREVIIGETGWATSHDATRTSPGGEAALMTAETSVDAQLAYLRRHYAWVEERRVPTLLFEAFDESWKGSGPSGNPLEAEKNWGVFTEQRQPKPSFLALLRERAPAQTVPYAQRPLVIAHRGFSTAAPENTLPAFAAALETGVDLVELDYHHTSDGVPVVIHDTTLDRTTDALALGLRAKTRVDAVPQETLATFDAGAWFDSRFSGTPVPTLDQALDVVQRGSVTLIERKAGDAATLARVLRTRSLEHAVVVQSFDWSFLRELHALAPPLLLGALGPHDVRDGSPMSQDEKTLDAAWLDALADTGAAFVVWNRQITADSVRLAHARGLQVWVYTIDEPDTARALFSLGIDGIITNNPPLIRQSLATRPTP